MLIVGLQVVLAPLSSVATNDKLNCEEKMYFLPQDISMKMKKSMLNALVHTFRVDVTSQVKLSTFPIWFTVAPEGLLITLNAIVSVSSPVIFN